MGRGGEEALASPRTQANDLRNNPQFLPFLAPDFDAAQFASNALEDKRTTAQAQIDYLQQGIVQLDNQLRHLVLHHRTELIDHSSRLDDADASLQRISLSVRSLQSVAARVRAEIMEPYQHISTRTQQLSNVQKTVDLLRHSIHRVKLVQRLRTEMASGSTEIMEIAKAARLLSEIRAADAAADLSGLTAVDADADFLASTNAIVRSQINAALRAGLDSLSQADVGSALQALHNLQELRPVIETYIDNVVLALEKNFTAAMDARKLSASTTPGGVTGGTGGGRSVVGTLQGSTARVQEALWERLHECLEQLWRTSVAVWHLQRVLMKKRDPLTHELFIDVVASRDVGTDNGSGQLPLDRFWELAVSALSQAFASAFSAQRGGFVREALVAGYPRLAEALEASCTRIMKDGFARDAPDALTPQQAAALLGTPVDAERTYLSAVHHRLQSSAATAFAGGSRALPSAADLTTLVARAHEELKTASAGGDRLATLVAAVVGSAIKTCADRAEIMAAGGPEIRSVAGGCTPGQARNIALCNALQEVHRSVAALTPRLPAPAAAALMGPLDAVQSVTLDLVAPLFRAMVDAAQERILRIHSLNLGAGVSSSTSTSEQQQQEPAEVVVETSACIRDLVRQLTQWRVEYLAKFTPPPGLMTGPTAASSVPRALVERMASRILIFYIRHAALVRPLSPSGKLQLAKDGGELEASVSQQLLPAEQIGAPLRALRAFRRLLFTNTSDIEGSLSLKEVPRVALLHHLFTRLSPSFASPHTRNKLSPSQYSLWLDEHSQEEAIKFIRAAVDAGKGGSKEKGRERW